MLTTETTSNADEFAAMLTSRRAKGIGAAIEIVRAQAIDNLSTRYPPASGLGEPPARRTKHSYDPLVVAQTEDGAVLAVAGKYNRLAFHETHGRPWLLSACMDTVSDQEKAFIAAHQ